MKGDKSLAEAVLTEVREIGPISAHEIATNLGFLYSSGVRLRLKQLEAEGLVESDSYGRGARVWMAVER